MGFRAPESPQHRKVKFGQKDFSVSSWAPFDARVSVPKVTYRPFCSAFVCVCACERERQRERERERETERERERARATERERGREKERERETEREIERERERMFVKENESV